MTFCRLFLCTLIAVFDTYPSGKLTYLLLSKDSVLKIETLSHPFLYSFCGLLCNRLDSPGESESCSVVSDSLQHHGLYSPWNSPGQNTGIGSVLLLQGIFKPGIKPTSPALSSGFFTTDPPRKSWASLVAQLIRNPPTMQKIWVQSLA